MKVANRGLITVVLLSLVLISSACTGSVIAAPTDDAELVQGQNVYARNCASCHGSTGGGGRGKQLNQGAVLQAFPDALTQATLISEGQGTMPAFGKRLTEEEITAVVRYTREVLNP